MKKAVVILVACACVAVAFVAGFASALLTQGTTTLRTYTYPETTAPQCFYSVSGALEMRIISDANGEPIASLPIQVATLVPACPGTEAYVQDLAPMTTNSSGAIGFGGEGLYYFSFKYGTRPFSVNASIGISTTTCVSLSVPSGDLNITYQPETPAGCWNST